MHEICQFGKFIFAPQTF